MASKPLKIVICIGAGLGAAALLLKILRRPAVKRALVDLFNTACTTVDQQRGWSSLPTLGGLIDLVGVRNTLRAKNLYDTGLLAVTQQNPLPSHRNVDFGARPMAHRTT